ncbi:MAG: hypothetical protein E7614_09000 [Ruminococcaceae bacterium]|nr:hypothetical protein [Oscillospiraceae bacterium]
MNREEFDRFVFDTYGIYADYPFEESNVPVYRHKANRKWFAVVLSVKKSKLKPSEEISTDALEEKSIFENQIKGRKKQIQNDEIIDVVNLKCPTEVFETVWLIPDIYPAYHMNKSHWISVPLDGSVDAENIAFLLQKSFEATEFKVKKRKKTDNC